MKTKAFQRKLSFQKHTVANLNGGDMQNIQGGTSTISNYSQHHLSQCPPCPSNGQLCAYTDYTCPTGSGQIICC